MFDLGNGDKEKLEENMEEIKQLVNEGNNGEKQPETSSKQVKNQQETGPDQFKNLDSQKDKIQDALREQDMSQISENQENGFQQQNRQQEQFSAQPNQNTEPNQSQQVTEEEPLDEEFEEIQEELRDEIDSIKEQQSLHKSHRQHEQKREQQTIEQEPVVSETNEEPLFLEVEKFEEIKNMIEEMHYLTNEIDDVMQHLEAGIQEDQETTTEGKQIIQEFEARREKIQRTLKNN